MDKNDYFNNNINLAYNTAKKMYPSLKNALEYDDLQQICLISLWKASNSYKSNNGCEFSTFAVNWIKKDVYKSYKKENLYKSNNISINNSVSNNKNFEDNLKIIDTLENAEDFFENIENRIILNNAIELCNAKNKSIILDYINGYDKKDLSENYNLSIRRINQIISEFIREVIEHDKQRKICKNTK